MVCLSCQIVVQYELERIGLTVIKVNAGGVEILEPVSTDQMQKFWVALIKAGLELMDDKKNILVEKIVSAISEMIQHPEGMKINFSDYLSGKLNLDYTYLANVFSETQRIAIEHYIIINKIKRVKQLICNNELNLTEISWKLNYSSVAHLSTQFKKVTGITPSYYKHITCKGSLQFEMCEL
ncbi:transcriptional regulator, AraC family [Mucilaginibacter paludis DSM 18603]|uniref:Transcriptional regulator, AraC family n=2 Tax=Mucilaginibacter TaxID=423349 RepID=H1YBF7_9SPHI|nr:transcriptional regulator, AraC family [Mucilaginibacter paludis DSM 18603]